jgi:hypothetical protein
MLLWIEPGTGGRGEASRFRVEGGGGRAEMKGTTLKGLSENSQG